MLISPTVIFAISQIIIPAGAATATARPNTNKVRSKIERTITLPICGFLYGGSSKVNEDGIPFRIVLDKSFVTPNVTKTPSKITAVSNAAETREEKAPPAVPTKNIVKIAINAGNAPPYKEQLYLI